MTIWCMVPEVSTTTDIIFCHFGLFFVLLTPNNPENQNFEKMKKTLEILHMNRLQNMVVMIVPLPYC